MSTEKEARRVLARAMVAIGRADDPRDVFDAYADEIFEALQALGGDHPVAEALRRQGVDIPLAPLVPDGLRTAVESHGALAGWRDVEITEVSGDLESGFTLDVEHDDQHETLCAVPFERSWVLSDSPLPPRLPALAAAAFRQHFDVTFALTRIAHGESRERVAEMRAQIAPRFASLCDGAWLFELSNPTGSSHQFFCRVDPETEKAAAYDSLD